MDLVYVDLPCVELVHVDLACVHLFYVDVACIDVVCVNLQETLLHNCAHLDGF